MTQSKQRRLTWALSTVMAAALTACGGGGGGAATPSSSTTSDAQATQTQSPAQAEKVTSAIGTSPAGAATPSEGTTNAGNTPGDTSTAPGTVTPVGTDTTAAANTTPSGSSGSAEGSGGTTGSTGGTNAGGADTAGANTGGINTGGTTTAGTNTGGTNTVGTNTTTVGTNTNAGNTNTTTGSVGAPVNTASGPSPMIEDCEMFPSNAIFNTRIDDPSRFPAHPSSNHWVNMVGGGVSFAADWGSSSDPSHQGNYWGMPINVIAPGGTNWPVVSFNYAASGVSNDESYPFKSDCATSGDGSSSVQDCTSVPANSRRFPFPSGQTLVEGGNCGGPRECGDHHVLVVERGACRLWESFFAHNINGQWYASTTAMWNLRSNDLRPDEWASGDAAGLPITPLLAKASEASTGEIRHALRVTFRDLNIALQHTWPGRHHAGGDNPGAIPFGAVMRLKADFVIPDHWSTHAKAIALAAKRYGLYVSDNGEDFYVQGEPNSAWNPALWQELRNITMSNMEFVDLRSITGDPRFNPNSMQASW